IDLLPDTHIFAIRRSAHQRDLTVSPPAPQDEQQRWPGSNSSHSMSCPDTGDETGALRGAGHARHSVRRPGTPDRPDICPAPTKGGDVLDLAAASDNAGTRGA